MKILIITHNFWPEVFPINDIAWELAKKKKVTVITGYPNYPDGAIFKNYTNNNISKKKIKNVEIIRLPIIPRKNGSTVNLILNYLSFIFSFIIFFKKKFIKEKPDIIFFYGVSPITSAIPAIILKKIYKSKLILWVQDLWPESISSTNHIKNKFLLSLIGRIVNIIYKYSDKILVQSNSFKKILLKKKLNKKIEVLYNSSIIKKNNIQLNSKLKKILKNNFCITYAGNIGKAQSLLEITKLSTIFNNNSMIKFLIIGNGSEKEKIKNEIKKNNIKNIIILDRVSQKKIWKILKLSQVLFITLKDSYIFNHTIPSKLQSYMAVGKPIIGSIKGESSKIIIKSKCGLINKPGDIKKLESNIYNIYKMSKSKRKIMGTNAKKYYNKYFKNSEQIKKLIKHFNDFK